MIEVAACYLEVNGKILLLQNASDDEEPHRWGVPAGKKEEGELLWQTALRELYEETGISAAPAQVHSLGALLARNPKCEYVFHLFHIKLAEEPRGVQISSEHQKYCWATAEELQILPLMAGELEAYRKFNAMRQKRTGASVNAYLILKKEGELLLQLRKNTGYYDGMWSLVAGHVEDGESATQGMAREAREEIGIEALDLRVLHIMHRKSNRINVDLFFESTRWRNPVQNREPNKCERLQFFPMENLPPNLVDYNRSALQSIARGEFYSEVDF